MTDPFEDPDGRYLVLVNEHWTDMRPKSLIAAMEQQERG